MGMGMCIIGFKVAYDQTVRKARIWMESGWPLEYWASISKGAAFSGLQAHGAPGGISSLVDTRWLLPTVTIQEKDTQVEK